jgi:hypothetical protein
MGSETSHSLPSRHRIYIRCEVTAGRFVRRAHKKVNFASRLRFAFSDCSRMTVKLEAIHMDDEGHLGERTSWQMDLTTGVFSKQISHLIPIAEIMVPIRQPERQPRLSLPSRLYGTDDAAHRTREVQLPVQHSGLPTYEEHSYFLLQQSSSDPVACLHRK